MKSKINWTSIKIPPTKARPISKFVLSPSGIPQLSTTYCSNSISLSLSLCIYIISIFLVELLRLWRAVLTCWIFRRGIELRTEIQNQENQPGLYTEMGTPDNNQSKGFFAAMTSGLTMFGNAMHRSVNG